MRHHPRDSHTLYTESNHRIANNLAVVSSYLALQARRVEKLDRPLDPVDAGAVLREASTRVAAAGELHRLLTARRDGMIDVGAYLARIAHDAIEAMADPDQIDLVSRIDRGCEVEAEIALKLGMIAGEVILNSVKYAHPAKSVRGRIEIGCARADDGSLELWVADDGVGLPEGFDPEAGGGLGLRTIRLIAREAGASLEFDGTDLGLTVRVSLPGWKSAPARGVGG